LLDKFDDEIGEDTFELGGSKYGGVVFDAALYLRTFRNNNSLTGPSRLVGGASLPRARVACGTIVYDS